MSEEQNLSKQYNPGAIEDKWYGFWEKNNLFSAKTNTAKKPFSIVIPPPNVTGILHMGHALNNTVQDILIRYHRLKGYESLWMPGTDHAGIATQNVVEKSIAKQGLKRQDLGRDAFIKKVWEWREEYGSTIIRQLKKLGASCDWSRIRFTMDEDYSESVLEVFVRLYEKGLIYRGSYIINWCPRCQTALSDEEAPHHGLTGNLYYLKYPFKDNPDEYVVVATTRPETMLGDTAVAVNPKDRRYKRLIGKTLILPLVNREIKIIADSIVDMEFGTGAVKVTPAHDPNDYNVGKKHGLEFINVMHPDARMNENAGDYKDMDRFEAREVILEDLKEKGLLEKTEPHQLSVGHCYRCHTIIEPYLSKQWFVRMKPLAKPAIDAVKKAKIKFYPSRWTKVYLNWMENIQDWCISRQIWWGHRIPVYYCRDCQKESELPSSGDPQLHFDATETLRKRYIIVSRTRPEKCPECGSSDIYQDEDVLDTWFSSWLWPFATFYWPKKSEDLSCFYPTSALVTAQEIIFFWVARMIMSGLEFMSDIPFRDVYIHGTVRDIEGKKMSKSLGNIIDPLDIIKEYGADALRFSLIVITAQGQDVFLSKERFEQGRNFANKIWNASRLIMMNLKDNDIGGINNSSHNKKDFGLINRWILSRFNSLLKETGKNLESYRFNETAAGLYSFFWHEFCDWYLEAIKLNTDSRENQIVMRFVLNNFLIAIHPFMPFISEEIWHMLNPQGFSIMKEPWPEFNAHLIDKKIEGDMDSVFEAITQTRNLRTSIGIKSDQKVKVSIYPHKKEKRHIFEECSNLIVRLARLESLSMLSAPQRPKETVSAIVKDADIYLHFEGLLDISKEQERLKERMYALGNSKKPKEARLKNKDFVNKAPKEVVDKEREDLSKMNEELKRLEKMYNELG